MKVVRGKNHFWEIIKSWDIFRLVIMVAATVGLIMVLGLLFSMYYFFIRPSATVIRRSVQMSGGIVLSGCAQYGSVVEGENLYIENTNPYPVRIRKIVQYNNSESTQSIDRLDRESKFLLDRISSYYGFYIYTLDGVMIGWLSGKCPDNERK